ncbi:MAG: DUF2279 domain-containing protein [Sedimentisphaerales bacterium]|nr:DUF2279 domain-containing protein [Sedimentisphaerales bacterium]
MGIKIYYRLLVLLLILGAIENELFGQNITESSGNYSFFTNVTNNNSETGMLPKKKSFLNKFNELSRKKKTIYFNTATFVATMTIGAASWDYYSSSFDFRNEGWFDPDTNYGGSDKLGHAFGGYVLTSVYNSIYKKFGYTDEKAILYGALSSWSLMTLIEVGDGFSQDYGFSVQDEVFNTAGVMLGYFRHRYPRLKEIFDYRLEWVPSQEFRDGDADPFTDYSGHKNIIALKPAGILKSDNPLLKAIELNVGFYTRGYEDNFHAHKRYMFCGIGLNMTYVIEQLTGHKVGGIFNYLQVPFTYIPFKTELD